jgi:hypothetical protein
MRFVLFALFLMFYPGASQAEIALSQDVRPGECVKTTDAGSPVKLCRTKKGTLRVEPIAEDGSSPEGDSASPARATGSNLKQTSPKKLSTGVRMFLGALMLDFLVVRHPFMMWYRKRRWVVRGRDSVDVFYGHMGSRVKFEILILWASLFVFLILLAALDAAGILSVQDVLQLPASPHGSP